MNSRSWVIAVSLGAGLLLGLAFRYQVTSLRRQERHDLWLAYVRGPLKLAAEGSHQGAELLKLKHLTPAQSLRLGEAVQDLHDAWTQAAAMQPDFENDAFFEDLDQAVTWHLAESQLADNWPRLDRNNNDELANARSAALGLHRNLVLKVQAQWSLAADELPWSPQEKREATGALEALSEPLP